MTYVRAISFGCSGRYRPQIVHICAHGTENELFLVDDLAVSKPVPIDAVAQLFARFQQEVRLAVFNACHSRRLATVVAEHIDCVIGMDRTVADEAAISFAAQLYESLSSGLSVREAFGDAEISRELEDDPAGGVPQLISRRGIDPAEVCFVPRALPERRPGGSQLCRAQCARRAGT